MPNLTVRDIPESVYERLRERAAANRRSLSAEIVTLLETTLVPTRHHPDALIAEARTFQADLPGVLPDLIAEGKRAGRRYDDTAGDADGEETQ